MKRNITMAERERGYARSREEQEFEAMCLDRVRGTINRSKRGVEWAGIEEAK